MEELLLRLKNKDKKAFEEIVLRMEKEMYLIARARTQNDALADEAVQETFLSLYLNSYKIKEESKLKSWMTIVLINKCNKIMREDNMYKFPYEEGNEKVQENIERAYDRVIDKIDLQKAIDNLEIEERTIITMYYSKAYTIKEISQILNINENTIKTKLSRSKDKIRNFLGGKK